MKPIWFKQSVRKPDPVELEFVLLLFLLVIPKGYWMRRMILALFGI